MPFTLWIKWVSARSCAFRNYKCRQNGAAFSVGRSVVYTLERWIWPKEMAAFSPEFTNEPGKPNNDNYRVNRALCNNYPLKMVSQDVSRTVNSNKKVSSRDAVWVPCNGDDALFAKLVSRCGVFFLRMSDKFRPQKWKQTEHSNVSLVPFIGVWIFATVAKLLVERTFTLSYRILVLSAYVFKNCLQRWYRNVVYCLWTWDIFSNMYLNFDQGINYCMYLDSRTTKTDFISTNGMLSTSCIALGFWKLFNCVRLNAFTELKGFDLVTLSSTEKKWFHVDTFKGILILPIRQFFRFRLIN